MKSDGDSAIGDSFSSISPKGTEEKLDSAGSLIGDPFSSMEFLRSRKFYRRILKYLMLLGLFCSIVLIGLGLYEARTSRFSARYFSNLAKSFYFNVAPGPSEKIIFPKSGPTDERRGYLDLPAFTASLDTHGFQIESQSRFSPKMLEWVQKGIYPTYPEKTQAGLNLLDTRGQSMFKVNYPLKVFPAFDSIPPQIVQTLLFIENRSLLDSVYPLKNPAIEWSRMTKAAIELVKQKFGKNGNVAGGSTLATQLEKYKHSEEGRTIGPQEKYRQMLSASLRAYQYGENTSAVRKRILLEYINTVPLAALPGYGEVNGLSDGLLAWYGTSMDSVTRMLRTPKSKGAGKNGIDTGVDMQSLGKGYRQVLNLFIAHRRPTSYLLQHRDALNSIGDNYAQILGRNNIISPQLRNVALAAQPELMRRAAAFFPAAFVERKHVNAVRNTLGTMLGLTRLYDLDRLDLTVGTTLDGRVQKDVVQFLRRLGDPKFVDSTGLKAFRLLEKGDPSRLVYSFTLYETLEGRNHLRVQADNYDQPLNINEGVKLDLGSTAKLRTLVNYMEIMADLHERLAGRPAKDNHDLEIQGPDPLTRWAAGYLATAKDASLLTMLDAAMERKYSGSTSEHFFTGGGMHTFVNFEADEGGMQSVKEAFRRSVNLVFIRMMRDIVNYYIGQAPVTRALLLDSTSSPQRQLYLAKFAEQEGQVYLSRFYKKYRGLDSAKITETFFHSFRPAPRRLATAYLTIDPKADTGKFHLFMRNQLGDSLYPIKQMQQLYTRHFKEKLGLADLGYVAGVHPLELWLVGFLRAHHEANWKQVKQASQSQVQETYQWLFKTRHKSAQDSRIRSIMEMEAFLDVHKAWQRLGYPFGSLVPSYATSIGSSADRPNALAELVGIINNDGIKYPSVLIDRLRFADGTPYETNFSPKNATYQRLLRPEVCHTVKAALLDIVEKGTAVRGYKAFPLGNGGYIPLGGKTGTGDQRFETVGKGGQVLESRVVNRTATFVFFLGDRFFGTLTAHVHGEVAKDYGFTSSLPVQLLKMMQPSLMPLLLEPREQRGRPEGFPMAAVGPERLGHPNTPVSLKVPRAPGVTAETLSKLLMGPAIPDTTLVRPTTVEE
jgi:membrane peptidoglycan carboxypeptidase